MSDLYEPLQRAAAETEEALQSPSPLQKAAAGIGTVQSGLEAQRTAHPELPPMASWDYDLYDKVLPAIEASDNPEETRERFNAAMLYAKLFDKPLTDTYENLETYNQVWLGKAFTPKTDVKAIADSMALGMASMEYNTLGARLKAAGGEDPEIEAQLAEALKKMEKLQDNVPRPWYVEAVKMGAQSLPYTALAAGAGIATAGLGAAMVGTAGGSAALMAAVKAGASIAGSGAASYAMMEGAEYADLRAQGVRHDIAAPVSSISALIQAGIESSLGNVAGAASKIGKTQVQTITGAVVKKLFISGRTGALGKALMGYAGEAIEEGAEELLQSLTSSAALEISAKLQKEGVQTKDAEQVAHEAIESFKGGFLASLVLGIPGSVTEYRGTVSEAGRVAELARTFDEKTFLSEVGRMNLSLFEGMNEEQKTEALSTVWKAQQGRKGEKKPAIDEKVTDMTGPSIARPGPARRLDDGSLYVKAVDQGTREGLIEEAKLQIGDPKSGTKYGEVRYRIDADTVIVDNVSAVNYLTDKSEVIHDALVELGAQHPGMAIEWNTTNPELETIRERLIAENPRGRESGLQWFDTDSDVTQTRRAAVVGKTIRENFKNLSDDEVQTATSIVYETARSLGFRPEDVVGRSLELTTREKIESDPEIAAQLQEARRGLAQQESGATLFLQEGEIVGVQRAAKEFERGMKAVIYAAENADFSTFTHEWFHFIDVAYIGRSEQHRRLFEAALGKRYDNLTADDREQLAYSFEKYLKDGSAPTESLKTLFKKIAQAMARAISTIARTMQISPELKKGYDALFRSKEVSDVHKIPTEPGQAATASKKAEKTGKVSPEAPEARTEPVYERRNTRLRDKLVEDMTAEERKEALLLNELSAIPNRRAYAEDVKINGGPMPVQVSIDADSLKWFNDHLGHKAGDAQLITIAEALQDAAQNHGVKAYHVSGDEYIIQGNDIQAVRGALTEAESVLSTTSVTGELDDIQIAIDGYGISYGINEEGDLNNADEKLEDAKRERQTAGLRAPRGEIPPNIRVSDTSGRELNHEEVQKYFQERDSSTTYDEETTEGDPGNIALFQETTSIEKIPPEKPRQPVNDLSMLYDLVRNAQDDFNSWAEALVSKYGGHLKSRKKLKSLERSERKITSEEGAEYILDIDAKTLVLDSLDDVFTVSTDLISREEVVRGKDRFHSPGPGNYRDMLFNVRMPNGAIVELQITLNALIEAKEIGHVLYETVDQIKAASITEKISPNDAQQIEEHLIKAMEKTYDTAFEDALSGAIFNAASLDITEELVAISEKLHESGAGESVLSENTRKIIQAYSARGRSSQSTNLSSGSSKEGTFISASVTSIDHLSLKIKSEAFKKWFRDSKIVDEDGNPLVVYHQTSKSAANSIYNNKFDLKYGKARLNDPEVPDGFFFKSSNQNILVGSANDPEQIPVYLSIQKPLYAESRKEFRSKLPVEIQNLIRLADSEDMRLAKEFEKLEKIVDQNAIEANTRRPPEDDLEMLEKFINNWEKENHKNAKDSRDAITKWLIAEGYDGVILESDQGGFNRNTDAIIALYPEQIKSIRNRGAWNRNDPRILFQRISSQFISDEEAWAQQLEFDFSQKKNENESEGRRPYDEVSPENSDKTERLTEDGLRDFEEGLVRRRRSPNVWCAYRKLKEVGTVRLLGEKINVDYEDGIPTSTGWEQIAQALQIYRNKRYETFRYVIINNDGEVIKHLAITSRMPGKTGIKPSNSDLGLYVGHIKKYADKHNAHIILVHNHPSGRVEPSQEDIQVTGHLYQYFGDRLIGHIILDHGKFMHLTPVESPMYKGELGHVKGEEYTIKTTGEDTLLKKRTKKYAYKKIESPEQLSYFVHYVDDDKYTVPIVFINSASQVIALEYFDRKEIVAENVNRLNEILQERGVDYGAVSAFVVKKESDEELFNILIDKINNGLEITDCVIGGKHASSRVQAYHRIFSSIKEPFTYEVHEPQILFQLLDPEIDAEARTFKTWQEWKDYVETFAIPVMEEDPRAPEDAEDAWYKERWEQANRKESPTFTSEEIDAQFLERIQKEEELEKFLEALQDARSIDEGAEDETEALAREEATELMDRIEHEAHPTILNNALRVSMGREITPKARKSILTLLEHGVRFYRLLYTDITGDPTFAALAESEEEQLPEIKDTEMKALSIADRVKLINRVKSDRIRKELMKGDLVPDDVMLLINQLDQEKAELSSKLKTAEKEIADDYSTFTRQEQIFVSQREEIRTLQKDLNHNERELVATQKKLDTARIRIKTTREEGKERVKAERTKGIEKRKKAVITAQERRQRLIEGYQGKLEKLKSKITEQRQQLRDLKAASREALSSARAEASLQKRYAVQKLKDEIRAKEEERREAAKIIQYKRRLVTQIMAKPSREVWYEDAEKIRAIQRVIDPKARAAVVKWEGETYEIQAFREKAVNENLVDILPTRLINRIFKKSIDEWTVTELEEMAAEVERLKSVGRTTWGLKEAERKYATWKDRKDVINQHSNDPRLENAAAAGSKERGEQLKKLNSGFKKIATATWTLSRIADWLDGGKAGAHTKLLVTEERTAYATKMDHIDRRVKKIFDLMKSKGIDARSLYETEYTIPGIGPGGADVTYTTSDLMYVYIGLRDQNTRNAILYGNLMDQSERSTWDNDTLRVMGRDKVHTLERSVQGFLSQEEKEIAEAIGQDFRDEFGRLDDIFINEFNLRMKQVNSYVPMIRQDVTASGEQHESQQAQELLNVAGVSIKRTPDKGFTASRIKISPRNQRAIKLDLYGTWMDAVERQEHFAAYTRYIRKLNNVYKNSHNSDSRLLRHYITQTHGTEVLRRVDHEINALANPQSFRDDRNIDRLVRTLRGNLGAAYLSWKMSSIMKQLVTSPAPYLAYISPLDLASSAFELMKSGKSEEIRSKSAIMRHRIANPIIEAVKIAQKEGKGKKGLANIQAIGMKGLEMADWVSVAAGWNAVYKKALYGGATEEEAVSKADDVTLRCQPSTREQDLSPLFKTGSEAVRLITQFQTALNVIWNQFTYDLPTAVKNKEWGFVVRLTAAYAIAGIGLGLLMDGLTGDDDELQYKRFIYWSMAQAFDSVPLIGDGISAVVRQAITGEKRKYYSSDVFPAAEELISAATKATAGDWDKAATDFAESLGLGLGLPVSGAKELTAVSSDPLRLIGRRK